MIWIMEHLTKARLLLTLSLSLACLSGCKEETGNEAEQTAAANEERPIRLAISPDPLQVAPDQYHLALDAPYTRVLSVLQEPGTADPPHSHPASVFHIVDDIQVEFVEESGRSRPLNLHAGLTFFADPIVNQSMRSVSEQPSRLVIFEVHDTSGTEALAGPDPVAAAADVYKAVIDNRYVRVLEARFAPGQSSAMHALQRNAVYVREGGQLRLQLPDGSNQELQLTAGDLRTIDPAAQISFESLSDSEVHLIIVEFK